MRAPQQHPTLRGNQVGATMIEYLLLMALVVLVGLAGVPPLAQTISSLLTLPDSNQASIGLVSKGPAIGN